MTVKDFLGGYEKQETRTTTPAEFLERWAPGAHGLAAGREEAALIAGFWAGWTAGADGGDMEPPAELLADLLADYREALGGELKF